MSNLLPVNFHKVLQGGQYTVFVLLAKEKKFGIYTSFEVGSHVQEILTQQKSLRPKSLDLVSSICAGLDARPIQLVIADVQEAIFFCRLFVEQKGGEVERILEIDTRASDGLILALKHNLPIFCTENVFNQVPEFQE